MRWMIVVVLLAGCPKRRLGPGQTSCTTDRNFFGQIETNCETGREEPRPAWQPMYLPPPPNYTYWCAGFLDDTDRAACRLEAGHCEAMRAKLGADKMTACVALDGAFCSAVGCYPTLAGCGVAERHDGRDPSACTYRN